MNEEEIVKTIQEAIDFLEETIAGEDLPPVYDRLVQARDSLKTVFGTK